MEKLTLLHWLLAFAGAAIYILLKIQEGKVNLKEYLKKYWASSLATVIMIPTLLLILSEDFSDIMPINNITAALVGYQTNSMFKTVIKAASNKFIKKEDNEESK